MQTVNVFILIRAYLLNNDDCKTHIMLTLNLTQRDPCLP